MPENIIVFTLKYGALHPKHGSKNLLSCKKELFFYDSVSFLSFGYRMLLACNKPSGITSFDVVKIIRTHFKEKVGHSGTLDPLASGLMILGVGKGTKKLTELIGLDKSYETTIDFSLLTDTWDCDFWEQEERFEVLPLSSGGDKESVESPRASLLKDGKVIPAPDRCQISELLDSLLFKEGKEVLLPLPAFSAKKYHGKRLYESARKGEAEFQEKAMKIYGYKMLDYQFPLLKLKLEVGSGTYIRSIGYRLGQYFGLGGSLVQLERTGIGNWQLSELEKNCFAEGTIKGTVRRIQFSEIM